ncbi:MAG: phage integrase SAM-like domain-containing protein [Bacteroidales bacterium]
MATVKTRKIRNHLYTIWTHNYEVLKVSTKIRMDDQYWDSKAQKLKKNHPDYKNIWTQIFQQEKRVSEAMNDLIINSVSLTAVNLKLALDGEAFGHKKSLLQSFSDYAQLKRSKVAYGTYKNIILLIHSLTEFMQHEKVNPELTNMTKEVFEKWISYQIDIKEYSDSTTYKHVKKLREFLNWAYPDKDHKFIKYRVQTQEEPLYITGSELDILIQTELKGYLAKTRDLFVFCCTTGMRYSDSQRFCEYWVKDGVIEFRMQKTGGKAIVPIFKVTSQILTKWSGVVPKISDQKYNTFLKTLFKRLSFDRMIEVTSCDVS